MNKPGPLCQMCPLRDAPGPVWGVGPADAKLVAIGMAPADEEIRQEAPFVGSSGNIFNIGLRKVGLEREKIFITNTVKCYVKPRTQVPPGAIRCCHPLLEQELDCLPHARTILTLGATPFEALSGKRFTTVTNKKKQGVWLRGSPLRISDRTIIPAAHPAYLASTGFRDSPWWVEDLCKAKRFSEGQGISVHEHFNYSPTDEDVQQYVAKIRERGYFGLDIETPEKVLETEEADLVGGNENTQIQVIGLSCEIGEAIGVSPNQFHYLEELFNNPGPVLTCFVFNAGFDIYLLQQTFKFRNIRVYDGMIALNVLYSDIRPKDLGMFLSIFTDCEYTKNLGKTDPFRYNAYDTFGAMWGGLNSWEALKEMQLEDVFWKQDMALYPVVDEMRKVGVNCDTQQAMKIELICHKALGQYEAFWQKISPLINWTQNKELIGLFSAQKLPVQFKVRVDSKTKQRKKTPCLDMDVLEMYRDKYHNQTAGLILLMRKLKKASDFCRIYEQDDRAHSQYPLHRQRAGRIQSVDPDLQNIPEELILGKDFKVFPRQIIIPDNPENDVIISIDYEQGEFWIYAYAAQDQELLEMKKKGEYIYGKFFEDLLGKPFFQSGMPRKKAFKLKDIDPQDLLLAKSAPLGLIYGRGANSLEDGFGISHERAVHMYRSFFNEHLAISALHTKLLLEASQTGYLRNFFGRIRRFPNVQGMRNEILSYPGQSNLADILRRNALLPLFEGLRDFGARLLFAVHDQVAISCPARNALGCASWARDTMEAAIPEMNNYWIPCEPYIGCIEKSTTGKPNWGDLISLDDYKILKRTASNVPKHA